MPMNDLLGKPAMSIMPTTDFWIMGIPLKPMTDNLLKRACHFCLGMLFVPIYHHYSQCNQDLGGGGPDTLVEYFLIKKPLLTYVGICMSPQVPTIKCLFITNYIFNLKKFLSWFFSCFLLDLFLGFVCQLLFEKKYLTLLGSIYFCLPCACVVIKKLHIKFEIENTILKVSFSHTQKSNFNFENTFQKVAKINNTNCK